MDIYQIVILSLIQGVTEFLPISSSAHLILLPKITNLAPQNLSFDIVVHLGTLVAIIFYYKKDINKILIGLFTQNPTINNDAKIGWGIILATIPVGIFGLLFKDYIQSDLRSLQVIAYATIFFAILLFFADYLHQQKNNIKDNLTMNSMLIIGCFQTLALIPGTSRSGITITAGLLLGLNYKLTTKFAFLLSIPVIILSFLLILLDLLKTPEQINWLFLFLGFIISGVTAYITIYFFIHLIEKIGMMPFVIYRLFLGFFLLLL